MSVSAPDAYVQLPFTTNPNDLADNAITYLQGQWPGWQPDDGDLSVVLIEALAPMAANAAQIAANMPPAALIALGTQLLGVPYQQGVSASATATFTVSGVNGTYDIPANSEVDLQGVAFQTTADLQITITNGVSNTGSVTVAANDPGVLGNNLTATGWTPVSLPVYVTGLTLAAPTSGGVDQQDDQSYLNSVAQKLQLRARSIITLIDFEIVAVNTAGIGKAVAIASGTRPRNITVYVTDPSGNPVATSIKTTLSNSYSGTRMVNAVITISDPAYTTVNVTYEALALPGVAATALQSSINSALATELSAVGWGSPTGSTPGLTWVDQPIVHLNKLIGVISGVPGVDYVVSCSISASNVAQLGGAGLPLSTTAATTSLPLAATVNALPAGTYTITDPTGAHTDTFTTTAAAAVGATSVPVTSHTANYAYPAGSTLSGAVTGDLTMNGNASGALPHAGTMTGTIDVPTT